VHQVGFITRILRMLWRWMLPICNSESTVAIFSFTKFRSFLMECWRCSTYRYHLVNPGQIKTTTNISANGVSCFNSLRLSVLLDVNLCWLLNFYRRFERAYWLLLNSSSVLLRLLDSLTGLGTLIWKDGEYLPVRYRITVRTIGTLFDTFVGSAVCALILWSYGL
jgi:hypothetical protein